MKWRKVACAAVCVVMCVTVVGCEGIFEKLYVSPSDTDAIGTTMSKEDFEERFANVMARKDAPTEDESKNPDVAEKLDVVKVIESRFGYEKDGRKVMIICMPEGEEQTAQEVVYFFSEQKDPVVASEYLGEKIAVNVEDGLYESLLNSLLNGAAPVGNDYSVVDLCLLHAYTEDEVIRQKAEKLLSEYITTYASGAQRAEKSKDIQDLYKKAAILAMTAAELNGSDSKEAKKLAEAAQLYWDAADSYDAILTADERTALFWAASELFHYIGSKKYASVVTSVYSKEKDKMNTECREYRLALLSYVDASYKVTGEYAYSMMQELVDEANSRLTLDDSQFFLPTQEDEDVILDDIYEKTMILSMANRITQSEEYLKNMEYGILYICGCNRYDRNYLEENGYTYSVFWILGELAHHYQ